MQIGGRNEKTRLVARRSGDGSLLPLYVDHLSIEGAYHSPTSGDTAMKYGEVVRRIARITAFLWIVANLVPYPARAHDPLTHQANEFSKARSKAKSLCCDGDDYTYINPRSWERTDKGFRVHIHGKWVEVPADAEVENMKNPDGEAKAWIWSDDKGDPHVRCFMVGAES